jgi:hypothetical protein
MREADTDREARALVIWTSVFTVGQVGKVGGGGVLGVHAAYTPRLPNINLCGSICNSLRLKCRKPIQIAQHPSSVLPLALMA